MSILSLSLLSITFVAIYFALLLYPHKHDGRTPIINGYGAFFITLSINIVFPATLSIAFQKGFLYWAQPYSYSTYINDALLITILSILSFCLGFLAIRRATVSGARKTTRTTAPQSAESTPISPGAVSILWAIVGIGLLLKLWALTQIGIGPELIARMSGSIRRGMTLTGQEGSLTHYIVLLSTISEAAAALLFTVSLRHRRRVLLTVIIALACMAMTFILSGKRSTFILPLILMICSYSALRRPLTISALPLIILGIISFGMATLLFRIIAPQNAIGNVLDYRTIGNGSLTEFYLYSMEFSGFDMLVRSIAQSEQISDILGGRANAIYSAFFEPFLYVVPRGLWADKPELFIDISHGFYAATVGGGLTGSVGLSATLIGYAYLLGGPFGVAFSFACLGVLSSWIDRYNSATIGHLLIRSIGIVLVFTMFRQGSLGWVFLIFVQNMAPAIAVWTMFTLANKRARIRHTI
ncbi:O-antigen polymerase [Phenylobacterium sp.]|uniref:O-antigen polymerase n=1 Tax=Phenylobacterium sp. TaxID=1871053 RepID=UPI0027308D7D|nr:O-antigen polymerase [Phenylobacterium sp.]MDP1875924.1 O-antigen polymerase [Phenylobacterium sp.]